MTASVSYRAAGSLFKLLAMIRFTFPMVTMFSVNGDHLIATHYCSARNQPQMVTGAIAEPHARILAFSLTRVTGMKSPHDWHNTGLVIKLQDNDHLTQEWTYRENKTSGTNIFHYTRVR